MDRRVKKRQGTWHKLRKLRNSLPGLIIESMLITFGVLLAFAVDNWKSQAKQQRDTATVLENLKNELISNRGVVLEWLSYHDSLSVRLDQVLENPADLNNITYLDKEALAILYPEPSISYLLQTTAWQTAHSAQVIRNFEYRTTYNLTHCYEHQGKIDQTQALVFAKLHDVLSHTNLSATMKSVMNLIKEMSDQERYILGAYRDALIEIDKELIAHDF